MPIVFFYANERLDSGMEEEAQAQQKRNQKQVEQKYLEEEAIKMYMQRAIAAFCSSKQKREQIMCRPQDQCIH